MNEGNNKVTGKTKAMYIVFSLVAAIAIWMYVTYVDNPETTWRVNGIPVEFTGEELLQDNNLIVTSVNVERINVSFGGRFANVSQLDNSNVSVEVDLSSIVSRYGSNPGSYQLDYTFNFEGVSSNNIYVESASYDYVTVTVERMASATVQITPNYSGSVAEGYIAGQVQVTPEYITVSGPQDRVSEVAQAVVSLNRENLSKSVTEEVPVVLMDSNGEEISSEGLILSQENVTITVNILMVKEVPLTVTLSGGSSLNEDNTSITVTPDTIMLSGDPEILSGVNQISLATIDQTKFQLSYENTYPIVAPNDTTILTGETSAQVTVEVIGLGTKRLSASDFQFRNRPDGYNVYFITQSIDVTLRGEEELLDQISSENLRVVADLSTANAAGSHTVPARIYVDGVNNVDAVGDYYVNVTLAPVNGE